MNESKYIGVVKIRPEVEDATLRLPSGYKVEFSKSASREEAKQWVAVTSSDALVKVKPLFSKHLECYIMKVADATP